MPNAVAVDVAEAVRAMLAAAPSLSQPIEPVRSDVDLTDELDDADGSVKVDVVELMTGQAVELASRGELLYTVPVAVMIRKKFTQQHQDADTGEIDQAEKDALKLLTEEVFELLIPERLSGLDAPWDSVDATRIVFCPHQRHLKQWRQFTSLVRTTFKVYKAFA